VEVHFKRDSSTLPAIISCTLPAIVVRYHRILAVCCSAIVVRFERNSSMLLAKNYSLKNREEFPQMRLS
jgi:hypothetical protein